MASYEILTPTKDGKPRIKIIVEFGHDEIGILPKLTETNIIHAITEFEKSLGTVRPAFTNYQKVTFKAFSEVFMRDYVQKELKVKLQ